jgi:alpha-glucosidase (family GH31 glycosyl hydrolase)
MNKLISNLSTAIFFIVLLFNVQIYAGVSYSQYNGAVICGHARFEFLSPTLVRLEYSPNFKFVDDPTVVVVKRNWKKVNPGVIEKDGWLKMSSDSISVRYLINSGKFTKDNLKVSWNYGNFSGIWVPGDKDSLSLGGVTTLDMVNGERLPPKQPGVLSKSGYFLFDDSKTPLMNPKTNWVEARNDTGSQDWYFFVYGHDYPHILKEFSDLCGKIPMVPRYSLGIWMTDLNFEYVRGSDLIKKYPYTSDDLQKEINRFKGLGLPLDVLVLDFGWHNFGWQGGYDWSPVFKNPSAFLKEIHDEGIHVTVNDHPKGAGESALSDEDSHAKEVRKLLSSTSKQKQTFQLSFPDDWKFKADPTDTGMLASWYSMNYQDNGWTDLNGGKPWEEQGFPDFHGLGWYRKWINIPDKTPGQLYFILGGAADQYDLFINGERIAGHMSSGSKFYNTITYTDVSKYIKRGKPNLIALRINDWSGYGGLTALPIEISDAKPEGLIEFNLADKREAGIFMNALHAPLMKQGIDFWWIDGSGPCPVEGLDAQLWTNKLYYDFTQSFTKKRGLIASRYAGWGGERYPAFFTGDTYSEWPMLAFQVGFTARGGNDLVPYITHDIGGFHGDTLSLKLYCRWLEFGCLSPLFRLHCSWENPANGNLRMPWVYGDTGIKVAQQYFNLRERLIPYIYTYSRIAYDNALPIARPLYLKYPGLPGAYSYPDEYLFGNELLVSPVVDPGDSAVTFLPPGSWFNYFTGELFKGDQVLKARYAVNVLPLFVKQGSIIPLQNRMTYSYQRPLDTLNIQVFGPDSASFNLYEDDENSLGYTKGHYSWTPLIFKKVNADNYSLTIGPASGKFKGQINKRAYTIQVWGLSRPAEIKVKTYLKGKPIEHEVKWSWDDKSSTVMVNLPACDTERKSEIIIKE